MKINSFLSDVTRWLTVLTGDILYNSCSIAIRERLGVLPLTFFNPVFIINRGN